jgi:hypothetical protein
MQRLREIVLVVFGTIGTLALGRQVLEPDALEAVAIPNTQEDVEITEEPFSGANFVVVPNSSVTIKNGSQTRRVLIQFSAEVALEDPDGDQMELGYSFNAQGCFEQRGPLRFAARWEFATYTSIHVPTLGPGTWTIQPCVRIINEDGDTFNSGVVGRRTLTAETLTK